MEWQSVIQTLQLTKDVFWHEAQADQINSQRNQEQKEAGKNNLVVNSDTEKYSIKKEPNTW